MANNEWMFPEKTKSVSSFAEISNKQAFGPIGPELRGEDGSELIQNETTGFSLVQA